MTKSLPESIVESYQRDGCAMTQSLISAEILDRISDPIRKQTRRLDPNYLPLEQRTVYDRAFTQVMNVWCEDNIVEAFLFNSPLAETAARLMGVESVRLYHDQALFKEPGGGRTPWHCDQVYWPIETPHTITAWFPLQDTPLEMGPLSFAKRSASITAGRDYPISDKSDAVIAPLMDDCEYLNVPFTRGDVSWHSGWTYHNAGPNLTKTPREAFTVIFMAADTVMTVPKTPEEKADAARWCPGIKPDDIIASPLNPVLWSIHDN